MNNKQILFFIAKSLTISLEEKNRHKIELILKTIDLDWELIVKISTSHLVLPAIYCNYKRANFLKYLPTDLVTYMEYITNLNRVRNTQIIQQAKKLNSLLLKSDIKPSFLKGTGNILEGLYKDIGERMIGDLDFLTQQKDYFKTIDILKSNNYNVPHNQLNYFPGYRHFSRLVSPEYIAAVEIHKELTIEKYRGEFNNLMISNDVQKINDFSVLSFENQFSLSIISSHINDYGFIFKRFSLRNAYDVFLLSKKVDSKKVISKFTKLKNPLNCFLANCNFVFGDLESLDYHKTKETKNYLNAFDNSFDKRKLNLGIYFKLLIINLKRRFNIVSKSVFNRENRKWLLKRIKKMITDKNSKS